MLLLMSSFFLLTSTLFFPLDSSTYLSLSKPLVRNENEKKTMSMGVLK